MKKLLVIIAILFCSCATSNKAHWIKVHPHGQKAGRNEIQPPKPMAKDLK